MWSLAKALPFRQMSPGAATWRPILIMTVRAVSITAVIVERVASAPVRLERRAGGVAILTLDAPKTRNALSPELLRALRGSVRELAADAPPDFRCLVLASSGRVFAAGADLRELRTRSVEKNLAYNQQIRDALDAIATLPVPTIAALAGHALGGGLELALACTLRVAAVDARLGFPEVKLGILPAAGGTQRLPGIVGAGVAWRMLLTGEAISAAQGLRWGLVDEVAPADEVLLRALELAETIAAAAPLAVRAVMRAVRTAAATTAAEGIAYAHDQLPELLDSADHREGLAAFAERRPAHFEGA